MLSDWAMKEAELESQKERLNLKEEELDALKQVCWWVLLWPFAFVSSFSLVVEAMNAAHCCRGIIAAVQRERDHNFQFHLAWGIAHV